MMTNLDYDAVMAQHDAMIAEQEELGARINELERYRDQLRQERDDWHDAANEAVTRIEALEQERIRLREVLAETQTAMDGMSDRLHARIHKLENDSWDQHARIKALEWALNKALAYVGKAIADGGLQQPSIGVPGPVMLERLTKILKGEKNG